MSRLPSSMAERLLALYDQGGQAAIYRYVDDHHPTWRWELCPPCDDVTPTWDGACAVCFSDREVP